MSPQAACTVVVRKFSSLTAVPALHTLAMMESQTTGATRRSFSGSLSLIKPHRRSSTTTEHQWFLKGGACLDVRRLEEFVTIELAQYSSRSSIASFRGLAERYRQDESCTELSTTTAGSSPNTSTDLDHVYHFLQRFVDKPSSKNAPPHVLCQVHSFMGLLLDMKGDFDEASKAHLRAVWCAQRCSKDSNNKGKPHQQAQQQVAASMCRLATSYGQKGDLKARKQMMKRAEAFSKGTLE